MKKIGLIAACCLALLLMLPVQNQVFAGCASCVSNGEDTPTMAAYSGMSLSTPAELGAKLGVDLSSVRTKIDDIKNGDFSVEIPSSDIGQGLKEIAISIIEKFMSLLDVSFSGNIEDIKTAIDSIGEGESGNEFSLEKTSDASTVQDGMSLSLQASGSLGYLDGAIKDMLKTGDGKKADVSCSLQDRGWEQILKGFTPELN